MKNTRGDLIIIDWYSNYYCAVQGNGDYMGGVITPGVTISAEALFQRAAKLPRIEVRDPGQVICRNTVSSMSIWYVLRLCRPSRGSRNAHESRKWATT